ncbi:MAG: TraB/GumN family protein [Burkholderiales bacterium]|nr:TraB/GumN family protein [Burkholderiales bacterium]
MKTTLKALARAVLATALAGLALAATAQLKLPPSAAPTAALQCPPVATMPSQEEMQLAARAARDRGLLWRITKDGRTSYLYGTVHIGRLTWAFPGPKVREALLAADTLALEIDITDAQIQQRMQAVLSGPGPWPKLSAPLRERMRKLVAAACLPDAALAAQHPIMQAVTLTVLAARWDGLDPSYAQELVLGGFARAQGRPVVSLETPESQLALLMPTDEKQALKMADDMMQQLEQGKTRAALVRMASAWERSDLADMADYEKWCDCALKPDDRAFLRRLNDERNPGLADGIDALHRQGKTLFAAVGSLHMTGPQALPMLLAQRGYSVERVQFAPM